MVAILVLFCAFLISSRLALCKRIEVLEDEMRMIRPFVHSADDDGKIRLVFSDYD